MSCNRLKGRWKRGLLVFPDVPTAQQDDHLLELEEPSPDGVVTGRFLSVVFPHPPLGDTLTHGTCTLDGQKSVVTFTRNHVGGTVKTVYTGTIIPVIGADLPTVLIRGTFERTTMEDGRETVVNGNWETEKPT